MSTQFFVYFSAKSHKTQVILQRFKVDKTQKTIKIHCRKRRAFEHKYLFVGSNETKFDEGNYETMKITVLRSLPAKTETKIARTWSTNTVRYPKMNVRHTVKEMFLRRSGVSMFPA